VQAIRNADDQLKSIESWRTAVKENNKPEIWQARIKYSEAQLEAHEQVKQFWKEIVFGGTWNPKAIKPLGVTGYANEENTAVNMRDSYCGTLQDKAEICRKDWDQLVADLNEVIKSGELTNQALEAGDKTGYFDMYIEHSRFVLKSVQTEKIVKQKYLGQ
jgi:hypothetical protein